ncbi:uncharacterized protein [Leptinotarsa decemlineata]
MFSKYFLVSVILVIFGTSPCLCDNFRDCPKEDTAQKLVAAIEREKPGSIFGPVTLDVVIPENGLFNSTITCVIVTDLSEDGHGGKVSIIGGGVGSEFVEIKIVSEFLRGLHYRFEVYTA